MHEIKLHSIGGNCPVQAEGTIDGYEFYFRARGEKWSMAIGGADIIAAPDWYYEEPYGDMPFAAGWMTEVEALRYVAQALEKWSEEHASA